MTIDGPASAFIAFGAAGSRASRAEPMVPLRTTRILSLGMPRPIIDAATAPLTATTRSPRRIRSELRWNSLWTVVTSA
ncbi:hypothetical protein D3C72_1303540 [compost metagenome]